MLYVLQILTQFMGGDDGGLKIAVNFDEFKQSYTIHKMDEQETVATFNCAGEDHLRE